ncbi:pyridoxamine 5'-phosphate oxidase family protein [Phytohabitans sp. ZYX-F-186]|uniref:Pyridoxamine 5'-phosphate oxidase family protein n=1 Tax=Phytohabitans maris TaxID=3071409 RepID=A0ABU0ZDI9_9ACTN|nr:pyridoxamine 5'-phosphate oxidase family protein [Phytohabitans sp. ZYX-F-186]MDQ7904012.1 pyridoxamine 5'-phosphate oxidase family protein [Phytohabitans sp. ZYX-F-186]
MSRRVLEPMGVADCLELLAGVSLGRIVYTEKALPAIRPVNHVVDGGAVVIRSHLGGALATAVGSGRGTVVAYEADAIDPVEHLGWSVVVTGVAHLVADSREVSRYQGLLRPWVDIAMDCVIRVEPHLVTGYRLVEAPRPDGGVEKAVPSVDGEAAVAELAAHPLQ